MPEGQEVTRYLATITRDRDDLFESMTATVAIPVRLATSDEEP
jgi:hypothetical protein